MLADRRGETRFEFVGDQWGSLFGLESLRLRNFGREGVLIESPTQLPVGSIHEILLGHRSIKARCHAAVRHFSPGSEAGVEQQQQYLIGLEFVNLDDQAKAVVEQMLTESREPLLPNEA